MAAPTTREPGKAGRPPRPRTAGPHGATRPTGSGAGSTTPARARNGVPARGTAEADAPRGNWVARFWRRVEGDPARNGNTGYYLILGSTIALTLVGLMMVLSASAVEAISSSRPTSSYDLFVRQGMWAVLGCVLMLVMSRLSIARLKRLAWPAFILSIVLLLLVFTPLGKEVAGNRNWIAIGGFTAQPSEAAKLALTIWAAAVLSKKAKLMHDTMHSLVPVLAPGGVLVLGLVMLGHDLGTAMILGLVLVATLFLGGVKLKLFGLAAIVGALGTILMVLVSGNRMTRINAWLGLNCDTDPGACCQSKQGLYALASGGWWGVGLGQSRQKWNYIPEASNDFIFTIIGEELGLLGTIVVIALFGILAVAMYRVAARHNDRFVRIATGGIMAWLIGQAFINIGMVTGLLPVIGVPLPFISYGGSALTFTLMAVGVILSFARATPSTADDAATEPKAAIR